MTMLGILGALAILSGGVLIGWVLFHDHSKCGSARGVIRQTLADIQRERKTQ